MLSVGNDDELSDALALDEARKRARLAPGSEGSLGDSLAARAARAKVHEEVPQPRLGLRNHVHEAPVARKAEAPEASPFEASDAQDEAGRDPFPEEAHPEALSRLAPREDENRIRRFRSADVDVRHSGRMIAWG